MATPVIMPRQGQSVETCVITEWFKNKGEKVEKGDLLFSYETDKASFEEEAPADGILLDIFFEDGDEVPVLETVAVIGKKGEDISELKKGEEKPAKEEAGPQDKPQKPAARDQEHTDTRDIKGRIRISPRARNKAKIENVPVEKLTGSGPNGRILERDVEAWLQSGASLTGTVRKTGREEKETVSVKSAATYSSTSLQEGETEIKKLSNTRRIIAENMHASIQNSAQLTHHMGADARKILNYRQKIKVLQETSEIANITINDMVCFAVIKALKKLPAINSHFLGDSIKTFKKVHLGFAVDTERGLMVPALRNADDLSVEGLSNQLKSLAESCKKGNIDPELLAATSASFTISNLGAYGVEMFTPVINLPQSGILGVNTIILRPANLGNGITGFIPYLGLSLTYDHRALDGAPASAFLKEVKDQIGNLELPI